MSTDQAGRIVWGPTESGAADPVMVWARVWRDNGGGIWAGDEPTALPREDGLAWVLDTIQARGVFVEVYPTRRAAVTCNGRDMLASVGRDNDPDDMLDQLAAAGLIIR